MIKEHRTFDYVSRMAFGVLIALLVFAIFTNSLIMLSPTLNSAEIGFPSSGTFAMLFDYSGNVGHSMKMLGQVLANIVAYLFMLAAVVIVTLSLALIQHNKRIKVKCAVLGAALVVPAVFGFTGGIIDFFAHGFRVLNTNKAFDTGFIMAGVFVTLILDVAFLVLAIICLVKGIGTAIKINKGELTEDEEEVPERAVNGVEGWVECFERAHLAGSVFMGGVTAAGGFIAMILALAGAGLPAQVAVFVLVSVVCIAAVRPIAAKHFNNNLTKTNIDSVIGKKLIVKTGIDNMKNSGKVELEGSIWLARSTDDNITIEEGEEVVVEN